MTYLYVGHETIYLSHRVFKDTCYFPILSQHRFDDIPTSSRIILGFKSFRQAVYIEL